MKQHRTMQCEYIDPKSKSNKDGKVKIQTKNRGRKIEDTYKTREI